MNNDFYYALLIGWGVLGIFWVFTILFIGIRKPPKSKLTKKVVILSIGIFILGYICINFFS